MVAESEVGSPVRRRSRWAGPWPGWGIVTILGVAAYLLSPGADIAPDLALRQLVLSNAVDDLP